MYQAKAYAAASPTAALASTPWLSAAFAITIPQINAK